MRSFHKLEFHMTRHPLGVFGPKLYLLQLDDKTSNSKIKSIEVDLYHMECL